MGVHFSSLVELQGGKSSVLFTTKMKLLVVLLSTTLVYGAAKPGHEGHIEYQHHEGPHCHDMKNKKLITIILVLLDMILGLWVNIMKITMVMMSITSVLLNLEDIITLVLNVKTSRRRSVTSILMKTLARSPRQLARKLLIPSTLRSVRKLSILFVRSLMNSIITVDMLLVMNLMWLVIQMVIMRVMEGKAMVIIK